MGDTVSLVHSLALCLLVAVLSSCKFSTDTPVAPNACYKTQHMVMYPVGTCVIGEM